MKQARVLFFLAVVLVFLRADAWADQILIVKYIGGGTCMTAVETALANAGHVVDSIPAADADAIAAAMSATRYDQVFILDVTSTTYMSAADSAALAAFHDNAPSMVIDTQSYNYLAWNCGETNGMQFLTNVASAFSVYGGGIYIGADHAEMWTRNSNILLTALGIAPIQGEIYAEITWFDSTSPLFNNVDPLYWHADSFGIAPSGLQGGQYFDILASDGINPMIVASFMGNPRAIPLQNGTATFSSSVNYQHSPDQVVDGIYPDPNSWAIARYGGPLGTFTNSETAVWETATDLTADMLTFTMHFNHWNPKHLLGRFRLSVTTDDRSLFADGLDTGADVDANWVVLENPSVSGPAGMTFTTLPDNSVLAGGTIAAQGIYTVTYMPTVTGITGIRLEAIEDATLPDNGPGLYANGNFLLSEMTLVADSLISEIRPSPAFFGEPVSFKGSTAENIAAHTWTSDIDGLLSTQAVFTTNSLSLNNMQVTTHHIEYCTTDRNSRTSCAETALVVYPKQERTDLALEWGDISFWQGGQEVTNPDTNEAVTVRAVIHNLSTATTQPVPVTFTDSWGSGQTVAGTFIVPAIAGGETGTAEITWTTNSEEGYHVMQVDAAKDPMESYVANNTATHFIMVGTHPAAGKLTIASTLPVQYFIPQGSWFSVSGQARYHWQSGVELPLMGGQVTMTLAASQGGETLTGDFGSFSVNLLAPMVPGDYDLNVQITDHSLTYTKKIVVHVTALPGPDLTVYSASLQSTVAGHPGKVFAYIANAGGYAVEETFTTTVEVRDPSGQIVFNGSVTTNGMAPNAGLNLEFLSLTGELFTPLEQGEYRISVFVDAGNDVVDERSEANNTYTRAVYVYPQCADLEVLQVVRDCDTVKALVRNIGGEPSNGGTISFADESQPIATAALPDICGQGCTAWVTGLPPYDGSGTHAITATIDLLDCDGGNNSRVENLTFDLNDFGVADLWVNDLRTSGTNIVYLNNSADLNVAVQNAGCLTGSGTLELFLDGVLLPDGSVPISLNGDAEQVFTVPYTFNTTIGTTYILSAKITVAGDLLPANNLRAESLWIYPALPDWQVTAADLHFTDDQPLPGQSIHISADVRNVGQLPGTRFQAAFYEEGKDPIGVVQTVEIPTGVAYGDPPVVIYPVDANGVEVLWKSDSSGKHVIMVSIAPLASDEDDPVNANNQATREFWVNTPPVAGNDSLATAEDQAANIVVLGNDGDPDNESLIVYALTQPTHGTAFLNPSKTVTYTPALNFNGPDSFTYTVTDGHGVFATATVTVDVAKVNDIPSFVKGANQTVDEDAGAQTVIAWAMAIDDGDPEVAQALNFTVTDNTNSGLFSSQPAVAANGTLTFTPAAYANGAATVTITLTDDATAGGAAATTPAQSFTITVNPVNGMPSFVKGANQTVNQNSGAQTAAGWATAINDGDPELSQALNFTVTNDNTPLFATQPAIAADGTLTYTPATDANGAATVTGTLTDDASAGGPARTTSAQTFQITVIAPPPVLQPLNLAWRKPTSASAGAATAALAVDGTTTSSWMSNTTASAQWVQVDLGASTSISNIKVYWPAIYFAKGFQVLTSPDGSNWTTRYTTTKGTGAPTNVTFTAAAARYVKVNCSTRNNAASYGVAEIEVYATAQANLAKGKPATAQSQRSTTYAPAKAVDGKTSTSWMSSTTATAQWLQVDLGTSGQVVSNIKISWPATYFAKDFQILTFNKDTGTWTQQLAVTGATGTALSATFAPESVRYVKVNCTVPNNTTYYGVAELEAYR